MKRIGLSLIFIAAGTGCLQAQSSAVPNSAMSAAPLCSVRWISFPCPDQLEIKRRNGVDEAPFIAHSRDGKVAVFAYSPASPADVAFLSESALKAVFQDLYAADVREYKVKDSKDFSGDSKWSTFEVSKFAKAGWNAEKGHAVHFQYVHLLIDGKHVIAGFAYEPAAEKGPENWYKNWIGGGNGEASKALQALISSITGEKRENSATPGGPPPPAPRPKTR